MPLMTFPSETFTGTSLFLDPPASDLVILYSLAISCFCAAFPASSASFSMNAFLSAQALFLTSLSRSEYVVCSCSFKRCDLASSGLLLFLSSLVSSFPCVQCFSCWPGTDNGGVQVSEIKKKTLESLRPMLKH